MSPSVLVPLLVLRFMSLSVVLPTRAAHQLAWGGACADGGVIRRGELVT